jgi:hypothetical protein
LLLQHSCIASIAINISTDSFPILGEETTSQPFDFTFLGKEAPSVLTHTYLISEEIFCASLTNEVIFTESPSKKTMIPGLNPLKKLRKYFLKFILSPAKSKLKVDFVWQETIYEQEDLRHLANHLCVH